MTATKISLCSVSDLSPAFVAAWNERELIRYAQVTQSWKWAGGEAAVFMIGDRSWQFVSHNGAFYLMKNAGVAPALSAAFGLEVTT